MTEEERTKIERLVVKLHSLASQVSDGQRVFGFATVLSELAEELATLLTGAVPHD